MLVSTCRLSKSRSLQRPSLLRARKECPRRSLIPRPLTQPFADLEFLEMLNNATTATGVVALNDSASGRSAVLGQPTMGFDPSGTTQAFALQVPPSSMPDSKAMAMSFPVMPGMPQGVPSLQQQYTHAVLQQQMWAQFNQASAAGFANANSQANPAVKRGKTAAEIAEQQEKVKRRRRESAQRSRQRKSAYLKSLEFENQTLRAENDRLRRELSRATGKTIAQPPLMCHLATSASSADNLDSNEEHGALHDSLQEHNQDTSDPQTGSAGLDDPLLLQGTACGYPVAHQPFMYAIAQ